MIRKLTLFAFLASVSASLLAQGQSVRTDAIVTTDWLTKHAGDSGVIVFHVGRKNDDSYGKAHIPGARFLVMDKIADMETPPYTELLPIDQLKRNLEEMGISDASHVVAYSPQWDPLATRLLWTLDYLGFRGKASFLEGGLQKWTAEKRSIATDTPPAPQRGSLNLTPHPEVLVKLDYVNKLLAGSTGGKDALIDSRMDHRYRDGHIPGAMDFYWEDMLVNRDTRALRSPDELRQMFARAGANAGRRSISYCEVGQQASYTYWMARYIGVDAAMYDGSWMEYSNAPGERVVKGDSPK